MLAPLRPRSPPGIGSESFMPEHIVIIGAGQSGAQAVATLRAEGFAGAHHHDRRREPIAPYQRPPLVQGLSDGHDGARPAVPETGRFLHAKRSCELILGVAATADRSRGEDVSSCRTDARSPTTSCCWPPVRACARSRAPAPILPAFTICAASPMSTRCARLFEPGKKLAIVGGGYIGLEVAAVARQARPRRHRVRGDGPADGARGFGAGFGLLCSKVHREAGVKLLLNTGVEAFEGNGKARSRPRRRKELSRRYRAGRHRRHAQRRAGARSRAWLRRRHRRERNAAKRPAIPRSSRRAIAPAISAAKARRSASNACRTPSTRPSMRRWRWSGKPSDLQRSAVVLVGPVRSEAADRRSRAADRSARRCAAIRTRANSPSSICATARSRRSKRSMPRRNIWSARS